MDGVIVRIPWGSWDVETGFWHHNSMLSMSRDEQLAQNLANGYPERLPGMRPLTCVALVDDDTLGVRVEPR